MQELIWRWALIVNDRVAVWLWGLAEWWTKVVRQWVWVKWWQAKERRKARGRVR